MEVTGQGMAYYIWKIKPQLCVPKVEFYVQPTQKISFINKNFRIGATKLRGTDVFWKPVVSGG